MIFTKLYKKVSKIRSILQFHFVRNISFENFFAQLLKIQITEIVDFQKIPEKLLTIKTFLLTLSNFITLSSTDILTDSNI